MNRELDAEVAEKVMGWICQPGYNYWMTFPAGETFKLHALIATWKPSESIETAMRVVDRMIERGWSVTITNDHEAGTKRWWLEFFRGDEEHFYTEHADEDSLPTAICHAALSAVAINPQAIH